jgi:hypothetical protein
MKWVQATNKTGKVVWVNLANVILMEEIDGNERKLTRLTYGVQADGSTVTVLVRETPNELVG